MDIGYVVVSLLDTLGQFYFFKTNYNVLYKCFGLWCLVKMLQKLIFKQQTIFGILVLEVLSNITAFIK